ncbi:MAG: hypothetical protein CMH53_10530, partial [Myxococcales bacterium]|nr:hypothetical protein [Myxococcales bacterium]
MTGASLWQRQLSVVCCALLAVCTAIDPLSASERLNQAKREALVGEHAEVLALLKRGPRTPAESQRYSQSLIELGRYAQAHKVLKSCSKKWHCAQTLGSMHYALGDARSAVKWFGRAMKGAKGNLRLQVQMGRALYAVGQAYKARKLLDPLADHYQ